jgi:hypothetical protein
MTGREIVEIDDSIISAPYCVPHERTVWGEGSGEGQSKHTLTTREDALLCSYAAMLTRKALLTNGRLDIREI